MIKCFVNTNTTKRIVLLILLAIGNILYTLAQDSLLIKGTVLSDYKTPFPNVSVSVEGSQQLPVVTNDRGEFSLKITSQNDWIIISPPGEFKAKRVFLNGRSELKIVVAREDLKAGDDKFTILNQEVSRKNIVASSAEINVKEIRHTLPVSVDQYLSGLLPGAQITSTSGMPGSPAVINIRGIRSINASNQPLVLIDGMPQVSQGIFSSALAGYNYNQLLSLNPFDISKITVIKDPVIGAAYGTNGSNGVIMIETLDPKTTETSVDVDFRTGVSLNQSKLIPQLNAYQHRTLMNDVLYSSGMLEEDIKLNYPSLYYTPLDKKYINYQHNTDWQKYIFNASPLTNINVGIKGGDEIARYGLSFGYITDKGIIKSTGFQGYNLRFVSRVNIFKWLKMNSSVSLNYGSSDLKEAATVNETSPILASLSKSPLLGPYTYDANGNETTILSDVDGIGVSNPLAIINNYIAQNHNYGFTAANDFVIDLDKDLVLKSKVGLTYNVLKEYIFMPQTGMERYYDGAAYNVAKASNNAITSFYNNTYLSYSKQINKEHFFTSNTGLNVQINKFEYDMGLSKNSQSDNFKSLGGSGSLASSYASEGISDNWNWLSAYENMFYSYRDFLLLSGSLSLDMSSKLGKNADNTIKLNNVPFGFFYSGGIALRLSSLSTFKNLPWMEDFKIRVSAGKSGNSDIGTLTASNYYNNDRYYSVVGLYPAVSPNDKLTYETVKQYNGGLDLSLLGNRVTFNFDIYKSLTENMLIYTPIDHMNGYDVRAENSGKMENKGIEFNTFLRVMDNRNFKWDVSFNIATIQNKVTAMKNNEPIVTDLQGAQVVNMVGAPANSFYGYVFKGVYQTNAEAIAANMKNNRGFLYQAGDAKFLNLNGGNVINDSDKVAIGSPIPKFYGGFTNSFSYKKWTLSVMVQFISGNKIFNYVRYMNESMSDLRNQSVTVLNRWQYDGQVTDVPRALAGDVMGNSAFSTRWIEDGSYLRVKNITLSYKLPEKFLGFKNGECYISAINMFTLTRYLGYDPEFAYSFSQNKSGIDYGVMPQPRQILIGVKVGL